MADYHAPTVVQPTIPNTDMTPLERLLIGLIFDAEEDGDGLYFCTSIGPSDIVTVLADDLKATLKQSASAVNSAANVIVAEVLRRHEEADVDDRPDDVDIDITERDRGWDQIFQDVVKRSSSLDEITVTTSFTCTKLRPDGFGGSVMLITADAIRYGSTTDLLDQFWNEAAKATNGVAPADPSI